MILSLQNNLAATQVELRSSRLAVVRQAVAEQGRSSSILAAARSWHRPCPGALCVGSSNLGGLTGKPGGRMLAAFLPPFALEKGADATQEGSP